MEKLRMKEKVAYGLGDLSSNILFATINFYFMYFLIKIAGVSPFLTGIIFIIARVWDAVTDYLMGIITDRTKSRFGKRRVYLLFGAIPFGLIFVLMWLTPISGDVAILKFLYYLLVYCLFNTIWTVVYIPYNALSANMTKDYNERTSLNGIRIICANLGLLLGAAVFAVLADGTESVLYGILQNESKAYMYASMIFGALAAIIMLICVFSIKERHDEVEHNPYGFFKTLKQFLSLKEFRNTAAYYLLSLVGFDVIITVFVFFVNDTLGFGGGAESMLFIAIPLVVAILTATFWVKLSEKHEKHKVYGVAAIYISIALLLCLVIPAKSFLWLTVVVVLVGIGMAAIQILPYASVPDVIEVDELVHGIRREGAYYGMMQFLYKTASGLATLMVSFTLGLFGYVENPELNGFGPDFVQPSSALTAIRVVIGLIPGIIFITSIFFANRANMGRDRFNAIKEEIAKRKEIKE